MVKNKKQIIICGFGCFFIRVRYKSLNEIYGKFSSNELKLCYCGFAFGQNIFLG